MLTNKQINRLDILTINKEYDAIDMEFYIPFSRWAGSFLGVNGKHAIFNTRIESIYGNVVVAPQRYRDWILNTK